jgi:hypothetical protein
MGGRILLVLIVAGFAIAAIGGFRLMRSWQGKMSGHEEAPREKNEAQRRKPANETITPREDEAPRQQRPAGPRWIRERYLTGPGKVDIGGNIMHHPLVTTEGSYIEGLDSRHGRVLRVHGKTAYIEDLAGHKIVLEAVDDDRRTVDGAGVNYPALAGTLNER